MTINIEADTTSSAQEERSRRQVKRQVYEISCGHHILFTSMTIFFPVEALGSWQKSPVCVS